MPKSKPTILFSESEIEKARELKRLHIFEKSEALVTGPNIGSVVYLRHLPKGCIEIAETQSQFLVVSVEDFATEEANWVWLPSFDELLIAARDFKISFSQITDFLHRRRFADGLEREGLMQLLIELKR